MLGILINTYNDSSLLRRALRDLFASYNGPYYLWIDDDGSAIEERRAIQKLSDRYGACLTHSPQKKLRIGPYSIVRELEIFNELGKRGVDRILKIDPDTTIYSPAALRGPHDADLYGFKKYININESSYKRMMYYFHEGGLDFCDLVTYCQGGFYIIKPALVNRILQSESWDKYLSIFETLNCDVPEDRLLALLAHATGGSIKYWNVGFFHGAKTPIEYFTRRMAALFPFVAPLFHRLSKVGFLIRARQ